MLPQETNELDNQMKFTCYYGNYFESEFKRIRFQMEDNTINEFKLFYDESTKELGEQVAMWEEFKNYELLEIKIEPPEPKNNNNNNNNNNTNVNVQK